MTTPSASRPVGTRSSVTRSTAARPAAIRPSSTTAAHTCFFVPPYLLEALRSASDAATREVVTRTLEHDQRLRAERTAQAERTVLPTRRTGDAGGSASATPAPHRQIDDAGHGTSLPGKPVRGEGDAATSDPAVNEAYDGLGDTWRLYDEVFHRDSVDGRGLHLLGSVHYSKDYDNAFWNGEQMVFGDGDGVIFTRFTASVDVIGHELTHGVTQYSAGLDYNGQSGALNESMSDVFGSLVKQYALGQTADQADWLIGAGILGPNIKGRALRDMLHPGTAYSDPRLGEDPQPADMQHYVSTSDDNGGVHINSGIPNRAFALAATTAGGAAWEGVGQVWYDVLTGSSITSSCDFATFARLTVEASTTRFGATHAVTSAVQQAWQTVGVLSGGAPSHRKRTTAGPGKGAGSGKGADAGSPTDAPVVEVRRTGGFAGLTRQTTVAIDQLPDRDTAAWHALLAAPDSLMSGGHPAGQGAEVAGAPGGITASGDVADGFTYAVRCAERGLELTVAESNLSTAVRHLFDRTLDAG